MSCHRGICGIPLSRVSMGMLLKGVVTGEVLGDGIAGGRAPASSWWFFIGSNDPTHLALRTDRDSGLVTGFDERDPARYWG